MEKEEHIRDLLLQLSLIGKIKGGHRVNTTNGSISVSPPSHMDPFLRWFSGDSRTRNIKDIERTLFTVFTVMESLISKLDNLRKTVHISQGHAISSCQEQIDLKTTNQQLRRFCDALRESKGGSGQGISELLVTYDGDVNTCERIRQIIRNIDDKLEQIEEVLEISVNSVNSIDAPDQCKVCNSQSAAANGNTSPSSSSTVPCCPDSCRTVTK